MNRNGGPSRHSIAQPRSHEDAGHPGAAAARDRADTVLDRLTRVDLQVVVVAPPDAARLAAQHRARAAGVRAGRGPLLEASTAAAREVALRAFARAGFSGTWAATDMSVSVATAGDRVAAAAAFQDAAIAAVVEDLVDDDTLEVLRSPSDELVNLTGMPSPGSLSAFGAPAAMANRGPVHVATIVVVTLAVGVIGLAVGGPTGLILVALALATVAGSSRRRSQPDA